MRRLSRWRGGAPRRPHPAAPCPQTLERRPLNAGVALGHYVVRGGPYGLARPAPRRVCVSDVGYDPMHMPLEGPRGRRLLMIEAPL